MMRMSLLLKIVASALVILPCTKAFAFVAKSPALPGVSNKILYRPEKRQQTSTNSLQMRDASASYWFQVGDRVKVIEDVWKDHNTVNMKGWTGKVIATWEKCEVDPHCCCAEQTDPNLAVRVYFEAQDDRSYFAESELDKVTTIEAFDGMSCTAFKLGQLKMGEQAQRLAAFEASRKLESEE